MTRQKRNRTNFFRLENETLSNSGTFIEISSKIDLVELKQLLIGSIERKVRFCQRPALIFSLIGNPKDPQTKSKLFQIFRQGLLKISERTGEKTSNERNQIVEMSNF